MNETKFLIDNNKQTKTNKHTKKNPTEIIH